MKTVQIKGANGSGKTTIGRQLVTLSSNMELLVNDRLIKGKPYATVLHDLKWTMAGPYYADKYRSGWDSLGTRRMDELFAVMDSLRANYPDYWMLVEGAMISTTMTTYRYILAAGQQPCIVILHTTMQGSLKRLEKRNNVSELTPGMFTQLEQKLDRIPKQIHQPEHVCHIHVDTLPEADMVYEFLSVVGWRKP